MSEKIQTQSIEKLNEAIAQAAATGVQSTTVDGVSVTRMNVSEMIKARDDLKKQEIKNPLGCILTFRVDKPLRN